MASGSLLILHPVFGSPHSLDPHMVQGSPHKSSTHRVWSPVHLVNTSTRSSVFTYIFSLLLTDLVTRVSQHHYSGSFCTGNGGLLSDLMAKAGVRGNISQFSSDISASVAQGLTYVFGETNSYACHGAPGEDLHFQVSEIVHLVLKSLSKAFRTQQVPRYGPSTTHCRLLHKACAESTSMMASDSNTTWYEIHDVSALMNA